MFEQTRTLMLLIDCCSPKYESYPIEESAQSRRCAVMLRLPAFLPLPEAC